MGNGVKGTTVIIACRNLVSSRRGVQRVRLQCLSLINQRGKAPDIIVVDGSRAAEHKMLCAVLPQGVRVLWRYQHDHLNLCKLWNIGIEAAKDGYIQISGADFVYAPDYLEKIAAVRSPNRFVMAHTMEMRKTSLKAGDKNVANWRWPKSYPHRWGNLANGICHATRDFFIANPYREDMEQLGAQDNLMYYQAKAAGMDCGWLAHGPVSHIWHRMSHMKQVPQFSKNIKTLNEFTELHGLAQDLEQSTIFEVQSVT